MQEVTAVLPGNKKYSQADNLLVMTIEKDNNITPQTCPVRKTLNMMGGKWAFAIIYTLMDGKKRFSELERSITGISTRMLVKELKSLEKTGVISRKVLGSVPPTVEYSLTQKGLALQPVFREIQTWAQQHT